MTTDDYTIKEKVDIAKMVSRPNVQPVCPRCHVTLDQPGPALNGLLAVGVVRDLCCPSCGRRVLLTGVRERFRRAG
jgi:hypothetical protein